MRPLPPERVTPPDTTTRCRSRLSPRPKTSGPQHPPRGQVAVGNTATPRTPRFGIPQRLTGAIRASAHSCGDEEQEDSWTTSERSSAASSVTSSMRSRPPVTGAKDHPLAPFNRPYQHTQRLAFDVEDPFRQEAEDDAPARTRPGEYEHQASNNTSKGSPPDTARPPLLGRTSNSHEPSSFEKQGRELRHPNVNCQLTFSLPR